MRPRDPRRLSTVRELDIRQLHERLVARPRHRRIAAVLGDLLGALDAERDALADCWRREALAPGAGWRGPGDRGG